MDFEKLIEDSKEKDIISLKEEISQIMLDKRYMTDVFTTFTFNGFYRARKHNNLLGNIENGKISEFINEKELWNPPIEFAKTGRCNEDGGSLFYCASDFITSILEVKPEVGDFITVANFKNLHVYDKPRFRIQPIGKGYLMQMPALKLLFKNYKLDQSQFEIDEFLDRLFHQHVEEEELYKYKLSIAISKIFLTNGTNYKSEIIETDGLIYSSIIRNNKSHCFVLKPWIVHCYFKICEIQTIQVVETGNNFLKLKLFRNGHPIFEKIYPADLFDIHWENAPINSPKFEILRY